jgi:exopolysaccharide biosynthesis polyprenyl glycosylphosphotransferase
MNKQLQVFKYVLADFFSAMLAWVLFYLYRKTAIENKMFGVDTTVYQSSTFYFGIVLIPLFWLLLYYLIGNYRKIYFKARLNEFLQTFVSSLIGVLIIFFVLILDDTIINYKTYYLYFSVLFGLHFTFTAITRLLLTTLTNTKIHNREIGFNTLLIGSNQNALKLYEELNSMPKSLGNNFVGFVHVDNKNGYSDKLRDAIPDLGNVNQIKKVLQQQAVEEVIIAIESSEHGYLKPMLDDLDDGEQNVSIKIIPDTYDIMAGMVKMNSIFGTPFIVVNKEEMPPWQESVKRLMDVFVSLVVMLGFSWVYIITAIIVKLTSKGPVFYSHERIGKLGKPFRIYKYRSMFMDAEKSGPTLSKENDPRITPFGRFLRKSRLDEIPQFLNVLIGEMSIVGPRPERKFFIDQIVLRAPHYKHLHKVKPGITSWGQVKYGYAENVDEMVDRLQYDIIYLENRSLIIDLKILIYTVLIVVQGRGK